MPAGGLAEGIVLDGESARVAMGEIAELTIDQILQCYVDRSTSAEATVAAYLGRIEQLGSARGIVAVNQDALAHARELDERLRATGRLSGPLHGVPIVVKDQFETADLPTAFGSAAVPPLLPGRDAAAVALLRQAGAIVLAKAAMADFGMSLFSRSSIGGSIANPYHPRHDVGGSSSGTAAAVAANLCIAGLGEDTSGSARLPSSFCSLVGFRPTAGLISTAGSSPVLHMQDTAAPMTRTVADAAALLDALVPRSHGRYRRSLGRVRLNGARIGVLRDGFRQLAEGAAAEVESLFAEAVIDLGRTGAQLETVALPRMGGSRRGLGASALIRQSLSHYLASHPLWAGITIDRLTEVAEQGADLLPSLALANQGGHGTGAIVTDRMRWRALLVKMMRDHGLDAICYPTAALPAPRLSDLASGRWTSTTFPSNTWLAGRAALPAVTVPAGFTRAGLPVGLELMGSPYGEAALISIADCYQRLTGHRRPPAS